MRNIRFKAKRLDNSEWVEGDLLHKNNGVYIYNPQLLNKRGYSVQSIKVDPSTVCQFTGLKDDFGKPIYENDIVDFRGEGEVLFRDGAFYAKFTKYAECLLSTLTESKFTLMVVCNKFDRKEGEV